MSLDYKMDEMFTFAYRNTSSDPHIVEMMKAGFYWPLTGLTCKVFQGLNDRSKVKMVKTHSRHSATVTGSHHILDAGLFPPEHSSHLRVV